MFGSHGSRFERCRFERIRSTDVSLGEGKVVSEYVDCSFDGSCLSMPVGGLTRFERCSFQNVRIKDWRCHNVELVDCVFSGTIESSIIWGRPDEYHRVDSREYNEIVGNDLSEALLHNVAFRFGVDLSRQRLPQDDRYLYLPDGQSAVQALREAADLPSGEGVAVDRILHVLDIELRGGQVQLFIEKAVYMRRYPRVAEWVFNVLTASGGG